jgi:hypothetical protein
MIGFFRRTGEFEGVFIAVEYAGGELQDLEQYALFGDKTAQITH